MDGRAVLTAVARFLGLIFLLLTLLYWVLPSSSLPTFLPGHAVGLEEHHLKHGLITLVGGLICFVAAGILVRMDSRR